MPFSFSSLIKYRAWFVKGSEKCFGSGQSELFWVIFESVITHTSFILENLNCMGVVNLMRNINSFVTTSKFEITTKPDFDWFKITIKIVIMVGIRSWLGDFTFQRVLFYFVEHLIIIQYFPNLLANKHIHQKRRKEEDVGRR